MDFLSEFLRKIYYFEMSSADLFGVCSRLAGEKQVASRAFLVEADGILSNRIGGLACRLKSIGWKQP